MERVTCVAFILAIGLASCSSEEFEIKETEVPPNVIAAFKAKYPTAEVMQWQAEKEDGKFFFEVEIKVDGKEKEIHISPDGTTVTEEEE